MEIRRLVSIGNTFYVCLPPHWISNLGLSKRDYVVVSRIEGGVLVEPLKDSLVKKKLEKEREVSK